MTEALTQLKNDILERLSVVSDNRSFNELLTALLADINDLSDDRLDFMPILARMFERLNRDENGEPIEHPFDDRPSSPAYNLLAPIAVSLTEIDTLIEIMRQQVFVYTATGVNLDNLGRDYAFPRFEATRAIRRGETLDTRGVMADFPIGSRFMTRHEHTIEHGHIPRALVFEIYQTEGGHALFRCEEYGDVGNTYFGDLSPASPINGLGRATIIDAHGAYRPGQNRETDEQYRRRFLRFLRRKAFGGNVAQYQQFLQAIDGVGDSMIFPVWRGGGSVKASIVDTANAPVSEEFVKLVNNEVDPVTRGGSGFGTAPIGHRVTISTPEWLDVNINVRMVLVHGIEFGQIEGRLQEIAAGYFDELRQNVIDEWERSYFANDGITNAWVEEGTPEWFPAYAAKQTHTWWTRINGHVMGSRFLETRLVAEVDFENILINGVRASLVIEQTQERQFMPRLNNIDIEIVDYIEPGEPGGTVPPGSIVQKVYVTAFDKPMSELSEVVDDE